MDNNHIEIMKEDTAKWEYKSRRRNTNPPQTPSRVAHAHGNKLSCELDSTLASIQCARNNAGIDTDSLLVIELSGQANAKQPDKVFKPLVRICNGKVMHNNSWNETEFRDDERPEAIVDEAIRHFHKEYGCRIFNLSAGSIHRVYNGGRQLSWAVLLDELIRELDIVIVVSAGNVNSPNIPVYSDRLELMEKIRNQLLGDDYRLIDPATTALGVTVGAITRYGEPAALSFATPPQLSVGKEGHPSAFTRTGHGVGGSVKPDFVDYGGNKILSQRWGDTRWDNNLAVNEPTLNNTLDKVFKGWNGTSFAAPHVTHIAARLQQSLRIQINEEPSANLVRAMLASSASYIDQKWLDGVVPNDFTGEKMKSQDWRLRLSGYGKASDVTLLSSNNPVTLFAEDVLNMKSIHLYKIPVPNDFLDLRAKKRIAIGFAYNPPARQSRQAYIANSLWFEVFRRVDEDLLKKFIAKKAEGEEEMAKEIAKEFRQKHDAGFKPGAATINGSTLQHRGWETGKSGGDALRWDEEYIYVLVTGKSQFKHPDEQIPQPYALAITFSYDDAATIELKQVLRTRVTEKVREQVRTRTQIQV
jgi:hypothetical protein